MLDVAGIVTVELCVKVIVDRAVDELLAVVTALAGLPLVGDWLETEEEL